MSINPLNFIYPIFAVTLIIIIKRGYYNGILKNIIFDLRYNYKLVIVLFTVLLGIILFIDEPVATYLRNLKLHKILILEITSKLGNTFGNGNFLYSYFIVVIVIGVLLKKNIKILMIALASSAFAGIFVMLLKFLITRERPAVSFDSLHFFAYQAAISKNELLKFNYTSMPSGHTITIVAAVVPLILFYKNKMVRALLVFLSFTTMFNRIYSSAHWMSDVYTSIAIGILVGINIYSLNIEKDRKNSI